MRLLNSQKNQVFKLIENDENFSPNQFDISELKSEKNWITTIKFKNSEYYFSYFEHPEYYKSFYVNYSPGDNNFLEGTGNISFDESKSHFQKWLNYLSIEVAEPILWQKFTEKIYGFDNIEFLNTNTKFSAREFVELQGKMTLLMDNISTLPLLVEQQIEIKKELERITELALDLGKFDWTNLLVGTLMSALIQLGVTKEHTTFIWQFLKKSFGNFLIK